MFCCQQSRSKPETLKSRVPQFQTSEILPLYEIDDWVQILKQPFNKSELCVISHNVRCNFPVELRSSIWVWLISKHKLKSGVYQKLVRPMSEQIKKDISRSRCNNPEQLGNLLTAYSYFDLELGYVQGMNIIAGAILDQVEQEEIAFWIFNYIINVLNSNRSVFMMDLKIFSLLDKRIQHEVPFVYQSMKNHKITSQHCFDLHLFTLFQCCRKPFALRIIDIFLIEKECKTQLKIEILFTVFIKLLQLQQSEILACSTNESLILYLRNDLVDEALDKLDDRYDLLQQLLSVI